MATANEELGPDTDFSYSFRATMSPGSVSVQASSPFGVAYALETLSQFIGDVIGEDGSLACADLTVEDSRAFMHRGIMIDTGRRFYPGELVKRTIDGERSLPLPLSILSS